MKAILATFMTTIESKTNVHKENNKYITNFKNSLHIIFPFSPRVIYLESYSFIVHRVTKNINEALHKL